MLQKICFYLFKIINKIVRYFIGKLHFIVSYIVLYTQNVQFKNFQSRGIPYVMVSFGGKFLIGKNFRMNNGLKGNPIGRPQRCIFFVGKNAHLEIGNNVGISQSAIICHSSVTIGNNVKIGGGVCIYDTDFHSLDPNERNNVESDFKSKTNKPVVIEDNVFIGTHVTILKGVSIGSNSIIGACSVVTKSIPPNEIWAGNPAHFIKKIL